MKHFVKFWNFFAVLCLVCALPLMAQVNTGSITGTVKDSAGAVVSGATVQVKNVDTGLTRNVSTGADGAYTLQYLPIGNYTLKVSSPTFAPQTRTGITLVAAQDQRIDFTVQAQNVATTVEVSSDSQTLDTVSSQDNSTLSRRQVDQLPLAHMDWTTTLTQTTGAIKQTSSTSSTQNLGISLNGLPTAGFNLTVDGTNAASDPEVPIFAYYQAPNIINTIAHDAIQEVSIVKGVPAATISGAMSGGINILTKSGTNQFHGDVFEINEISALDARNYFATAKPRLTFNQFGGSFSGPIIKNKMFFFYALEGARESQFTPITGSVPTQYALSIVPSFMRPELQRMPILPTPTGLATDCYGTTPSVTDPACASAASATYHGTASQKNYDSSNVARIDHTIGDRDSWYVRYTRNRPYQNLPNVNTTNPQITTAHGDVYNAGYVHQFSNLTSSSRFGYNRLRLSRNQIGYATDNEGISIASGFNTGYSEAFIKAGRVVTGDQQFAMTVGKHSLQFGGIIQRNDGGRTDLNTVQWNYTTNAQLAANTPSSAKVNFPVTPFNLYEWQIGAFIQDAYRMTPTLTLNLGFRYDYYTVVKESSGRLFNRGNDPTLGPGFGAYLPADGVYAPDLHTGFQPRVGFAWNPKNTGTVVRGAFGIMTTRRPFYGGPIELSPSATGQPENLNLSQSQLTASKLAFPLPASAIPSIVPLLQATGAVGTSFSGTSMDYISNNPTAQEWTLDVEQSLPLRMVLDLGYVGNHALNENITFVANLPSRTTGIAPIPTWGSFNRYIPGDKSNYNALQVKLTKQTQWGLTYGANYTWAHSLAYGDANILLETSMQDINNKRSEYGPTQYDIRNNFTANALWDLPLVRWFSIDNHAARLIADGWRITSVINARTGLPINVTNNASVNKADRPSLIPGVDPYTHQYHSATDACPHHYLNGPSASCHLTTTAFTGTAVNSGSIQTVPGTMTRDELRNIGYFTIDATVNKQFKLPHDMALGFHVDAFNLMNHTNFSGLGTAYGASTFGFFTSAVNRTIQLGGKFNF